MQRFDVRWTQQALTAFRARLSVDELALREAVGRSKLAAAAAT